MPLYLFCLCITQEPSIIKAYRLLIGARWIDLVVSVLCLHVTITNQQKPWQQALTVMCDDLTTALLMLGFFFLCESFKSDNDGASWWIKPGIHVYDLSPFLTWFLSSMTHLRVKPNFSFVRHHCHIAYTREWRLIMVRSTALSWLLDFRYISDNRNFGRPSSGSAQLKQSYKSKDQCPFFTANRASDSAVATLRILWMKTWRQGWSSCGNSVRASLKFPSLPVTSHLNERNTGCIIVGPGGVASKI